MATTTTKPDMGVTTPPGGSVGVPGWPRETHSSSIAPTSDAAKLDGARPSQRDALQALLAFSALHEQIRRRKALAARHAGFDRGAPVAEFEREEQFVLDDVLRLVAERGAAITGADGLAIALAENNEIVLRAAAGVVRPDVGARIERDSAFSGACFNTAQIVTCDDTETDARVNLISCRKLGARSMVAVPLCGRRRVIGVLEAFSAWPFAFNESDVRNLSLLAELVVGALRPEDEDRFAESAQVASSKLEAAPRVAKAPASEPVKVVTPPTAHGGSAAAAAAPALAPTAPVIREAEKKSPTVEAKPAPAAEKASPVAPSARTVAPAILDKPAAEPQRIEPGKIIAPKPDAPKPGATKVELPKGDTQNIETAKAAGSKIEVKAESAKPDAAKLEVAAAPETAVAPELVLSAVQEEKRRPVPLIILLCVVVTVAFASGVWVWKTAQVNNGLVPTTKVPSKAAEPQAPKDTIAPPTPGLAAGENATTTANPDAETISDSSDEAVPATAQEMAKFPRVTGIRHWSSAGSSTVVLDLEDQVQYEAHRLANPDRIYFDLRDTQLASDLVSKAIEVGDAFVSKIRVAQPVAGMTRIVLETRSNSTFSVSLEPNPYRLVVEIRKIGATPKAEINLFPNSGETEKNKLAIVVPPPTKEDLALRARVPKLRIVVDAGHGGWDLGTVGRRGLLEKDLVFEIAQRLGKLLEGRLGSEVIYTRQDDNYITLDERAAIANTSQADLFVSVHANYSDLRSARGVETYYTNFFTAPGAKDLDTHSAAGAAKPANIPTLSPADLHERIEHSRELAASVQKSLYGTLSAQNPGLRNRGVKEASFVVLTESAMPGILAEVSFVSSPTDEQKLRSDGYREEIAEALYRGIARYAAASKSVRVASAK